MQNFFKNQVQNLEDCLRLLDSSKFQLKLDLAIQLLSEAVIGNKPVLVCGNGGSAADSQHIAGELVGKFLKERRALNVKALSTDTSVITAWANDVSYDTVFARQVEAYSQAGGVLWAISTSGNSKNVLFAAKKAKELGMSVVGLTGEGGGLLSHEVDILLDVPSKITPRIQEIHMMIYHYICETVESNF